MKEGIELQVQSIIKLDSTNFEKLFNELYLLLCRCAIRYVRIPEIAEELVQEQFKDLWEKRSSIIIHTSIKSYLFKSVKNKSIDYLKSQFAKQKFVNEEFSYALVEKSNPLKNLEEQEFESLITEAVKALPKRCYIIFSLSRYGDLTNKQIAEELNISEKTVEAQITVAIKKIRFAIEEYRLS